MDEPNRGGQDLRLLLHGEVVSQPARKDEVHGCLQVSSHHLHHTSQYSSLNGTQHSYFYIIHVQLYMVLWIRIRSDRHNFAISGPVSISTKCKDKLYGYLFFRKF
jgi:hypothetical protein